MEAALPTLETANNMSEGPTIPNFYDWKSNRQFVCDTQVHKNHDADGLSLNAQHELPSDLSSAFCELQQTIILYTRVLWDVASFSLTLCGPHTLC